MVIIFIFGNLTKNITAPTTTDYSENPQLSCFGTKARVEFKGKQIKIAYDHRKEVNNYIVYEIVSLYGIYACGISICPALENCLFGPVALTKNNDLDIVYVFRIWYWIW